MRAVAGCVAGRVVRVGVRVRVGVLTLTLTLTPSPSPSPSPTLTRGGGAGGAGANLTKVVADPLEYRSEEVGHSESEPASTARGSPELERSREPLLALNPPARDARWALEGWRDVTSHRATEALLREGTCCAVVGCC